MKYEDIASGIPNYNNMVNMPEILISNIEKMQVAFILSSSTSESEDTCGMTHAHDNFELQYIAEKDIEMVVDNTRLLKLQKGDLLLLPPHTYHKTCSKSQGSLRYCINFSALTTPASGDKTIRENILSSVKQEIVFRNDEIEHFILKIFEATNENSSLSLKNKLYLNLIFEEIITLFNEKKVSLTTDTSSGDVTYQIDMQRKWAIETYVSHFYMHRNHTENLAGILGLSPRQASRVIKELMGCTLQELILTQRMIVAMEFIKFSNMSLTQISDTLGYSTYYGFYTAFCKHYGLSPELACKQFKK